MQLETTISQQPMNRSTSNLEGILKTHLAIVPTGITSKLVHNYNFQGISRGPILSSMKENTVVVWMTETRLPVINMPGFFFQNSLYHLKTNILRKKNAALYNSINPLRSHLQIITLKSYGAQRPPM